ncbi:multidrug resistance-associated protein 1-like [Clarias magur]|uniref:Multidrug resistance-associated protein 1-like n=1 Tax=Clarias magur TaxID=1594786 RepID=A0A8J4UB83_CLAMG|nr:multidrug resistance-associated protein 1-like [Clarias magur]
MCIAAGSRGAEGAASKHRTHTADDSNLTWNTSTPNLTKCFQHTVLVWVPCFYLWVCSPFYVLYLRCFHHGLISISRLCRAKTVLGMCLVLFWILELFCLLSENGSNTQLHMVFLLSPIIRILTMNSRQAVIRCLLFFSCFPLTLVQLILSCFTDRRPNAQTPGHVTKNPCPVEDASFLSKTLFWWFTRLAVRGYRSPLKPEDLWSLREEDTSEKIISDLEREWNTQCAHQERIVNPPRTLSCKITEQTQFLQKLRQEQSAGFLLLRTLVRTFGPCFLSGTLCLLVHDAFMFAIPQLLRLLLDVVSDKGAPEWRGYLFASSMFLLSCLQSLFNHQYMYSCFTVGMRVKTAIMGLVYRKVASRHVQRSCARV